MKQLVSTLHKATLKIDLIEKYFKALLKKPTLKQSLWLFPTFLNYKESS